MQYLQDRLTSTCTTLEQEQLFHQQTKDALQSQTVIKHTLEQHVTDLKVQLSTNEEHRQSLEEKHQHAQKALEHYRQSVKEQRDQDLRRHDQQVQHLQSEIRLLQQTIIIKQDEVTNLKGNNLAITTELNLLKQSFEAEIRDKNALLQKNKELELIENQYNYQNNELTTKENTIQALKEDLSLQAMKNRGLENLVTQSNLEIGIAQSKLASQDILITELRLMTKSAHGISKLNKQ